ncbi:2,4-dienoyl-CoA reductase-like NADH-dependent reductase (Old Yellow Enzyme family) [Nonomuraea angiospora]|uniref:2,4-dienoyl-CoA reductase-like NADH-dependent reductase (Old Yellow Enzyme family) n=1 Tax=Nonomuraea angiospora TaxID=46172 RepID=A0ABR9LN96_9ACTN|nr:2,4-dienoyl-CoA reductase-like NADH-dependent reductase (Old Yellow Enzyme family) [Nonomuraea angiospora]
MTAALGRRTDAALGGLRLANRIVMTPMTRSRAYGPGAG